MDNLIESALYSLKQAKESKQVKNISEAKIRPSELIDSFMNEILRLYLFIENQPSYKKDIKYQNFIKNSEYILRRLIYQIVKYILQIESEFDSDFYYAEQWKNRVCWKRSAVEALKEMYKGTFLEQFYYELDTEDLDDSIEMRAHKEGGLKEDQIPKGIPTSHWWWWSPEEPPSSR